MFSPPPERLMKEIDGKIEELSQVISTMPGDLKLLEAKLNNVKLKKLKLMALSCLPHRRTVQQNVMSAIDMMIAESDVDIEVETMKSLKLYRRTDSRRRDRLLRGPYTRRNMAHNSTPRERYSSVSSNSEEITDSSQQTSGNTQQNVPLDLSNFFHRSKAMCDRGTNTEPVCILDAKDNIISSKDVVVSPATFEAESPFKETANHEQNLSQILSDEDTRYDIVNSTPKNIMSSAQEISSTKNNINIREILSPASCQEDMVMSSEERESNKRKMSPKSPSYEIEIEMTAPKLIPTSPVKDLMLSTEDQLFMTAKELVSSTKIQENVQSNAYNVSVAIESKWFENTFESNNSLDHSKELAQIKKLSKTSEKLSKKQASHSKKEKTSSEIYKDKNEQNSHNIKLSKDTNMLETNLANTDILKLTPEVSHSHHQVLKLTPEVSHSHHQVLNLFNTYNKIHKSGNSNNKTTDDPNKALPQRNSNERQDLPRTNNLRRNMETKQHFPKALNYKETHASTSKAVEYSCNFAKKFKPSQDILETSPKNFETHQKYILNILKTLDNKENHTSTSKSVEPNAHTSRKAKHHKKSHEKSRKHSHREKSSEAKVKKDHKTSSTEKQIKQNIETPKSSLKTTRTSEKKLVSELFRDLMASKQYHSGIFSDCSSPKTSSRYSCGKVYEGHMCVCTIRQILEQC